MQPSSIDFHPGEKQAQQKARTTAFAADMSKDLSCDLSRHPSAIKLLESAQHIWYSAPQEGDLWLTPLFGQPGFVNVLSCTTIEIQPVLREGEHTPLQLSARPSDPFGFLVMDFATRRRFRINGVVTQVQHEPYILRLSVQEAFPNCPKYIFRRMETSLHVNERGRDQARYHPCSEESTLSKADCDTVLAANIFMLGTMAHGKADANHRGGHSGFVRVLDTSTLLWPDYRGNGMFQSLGNMYSNAGQVAVTFFDFHCGALLQLHGSAEVIERDSDENYELASVERAAQRAVKFSIQRVRRWAESVTSLRWKEDGPSHYTPSLMLGVSTSEESENNSLFPQSVVLVKTKEEGGGVKTFRFIAKKPLIFLPGQYATFEFPGDVFGREEQVVRTWTLSGVSVSEDGDVTLQVSVKQKEGGLVSTFLHKQASTGLRARVLGIDGEMTPFTSGLLLNDYSVKAEKRFCLISGGVGITPNVAILRGLMLNETEADIAFVYQGREGEMPFQKDIERRAASSRGRLRVLQAFSADMGSGVPREKGTRLVRGRIGTEVLQMFVPDISRRMVFVCGPTGFMDMVMKSLCESRVPAHAIVTEKFDF